MKKAGKKTHSKRLSCQSSEGRDAVPREGGVYNVPGGSCLFGELLRAVGRNPGLRNRKGAQRWVWDSLWELEVTGLGQGGGGRSKEAALLRTGREEGEGRLGSVTFLTCFLKAEHPHASQPQEDRVINPEAELFENSRSVQSQAGAATLFSRVDTLRALTVSTLHDGPRRAREHQQSEEVRTVRRRLAFQRSEPSVEDRGLRKREGCWGKRASSPSLFPCFHHYPPA